MDELLASAFAHDAQFEVKPSRLRKIYMTVEETAAVRALHRKFVRLDITLVTNMEEAASRILASLPPLPQQEDLLRSLATELGEEIYNHPEAHISQLFTLHLRLVRFGTPDTALPLRSGRIARFVALPVHNEIGPRGNFMPYEANSFFESADIKGEDFFLMAIYPNCASEGQVIDPQQENRVLGDQQILRVKSLQAKLLAETMGACIASHEMNAALYPTLSHLRRIGVQLAVYLSVRNSGVKPDVKESRLLQLHQVLSHEARALAVSFGKDILNTKLPTTLRTILRIAIQELCSSGILSIRQEFETRYIIVPRMDKIVAPAPQPPTFGKVIPLRNRLAEKARMTPAKTLQHDTLPSA